MIRDGGKRDGWCVTGQAWTDNVIDKVLVVDDTITFAREQYKLTASLASYPSRRIRHAVSVTRGLCENNARLRVCMPAAQRATEGRIPANGAPASALDAHPSRSTRK